MCGCRQPATVIILKSEHLLLQCVSSCSDPSYSTSDPDNIVALRLWRGSSSTPKTVPTMFKMMTEKNKKQRALALLLIDTNPDLRFTRSWTYEEYYSDCIAVAKAFIKVK